ncbi:MAG: hypothetical protein LJE96_17235, partial [Deltaproteobacteria bacterium]|nr:hypothetical protein [Deltaproteobacteria bacterium]
MSMMPSFKKSRLRSEFMVKGIMASVLGSSAKTGDGPNKKSMDKTKRVELQANVLIVIIFLSGVERSLFAGPTGRAMKLALRDRPKITSLLYIIRKPFS